jgi:hypothetical protein
MKILTILLLIGFQQIINPSLSPNLSIHDEITEDEKKQILSSVTSVVNKYCESGNFWNSNIEEFDEDKYADFIELFAGNATIHDDLSFNREDLPYSQYAQKIFDNLQEIGVPFLLKDVVINKIDIDESGFYVIDVNLTKRMFAGISKIGKPIKLKTGRQIKLNMRIDLPDYLLSDARIQYIQPQKPKSVIDYVKQPISFVSQKLKRN